MNLIPKICELIGVEIGENFKIKNGVSAIYKFQGSGLYTKKQTEDSYWCVCNDITLRDILVGIAKIEKLPFEPKDGEKYWTVYWKGIGDMPCAVYENWRGDSCDFANKVSGNCFRTEAEAENHKYEIYEKLTGKKREE